MSSAEERIAIGRAGELDELLAGVFAVLPAALALFGATDGDFRIVQWNDDFERLLGADRRLVPGETLEEVFHRAERQAITELFRRVRASKEPGGLFAPDFERPGPAMATILWNLDAYPVIGEGGRVTHIVAVAQRTLERLAARERQARETVRLRERAEHLQELERAKSEFLNLASHELRGPAATLRGYLSMLEDGTLGPLPEGLRQVLPVLQAKASQINVLASEMIEAARLEERGMELHREPVDMRELLTRLAASVQATAPHHRLVIHDRSPGPVVVSGDRLRLEIAVNNLLDNAVKYSPGGGDIYCDLSSVKDMMLLAVRDTGIGIAAEDMPRLFVRFSRLAAETMPDVPGTGLGLYLARELARLHGADTVAVSGPGEGSEFTLTPPPDEPAAR